MIQLGLVEMMAAAGGPGKALEGTIESEALPRLAALVDPPAPMSVKMAWYPSHCRCMACQGDLAAVPPPGSLTRAAIPV